VTWSRQQRHKARTARLRPGVTVRPESRTEVEAPGRTVCARCLAPIASEAELREHYCPGPALPPGDPYDLLER
jgi:hypothetical protein